MLFCESKALQNATISMGLRLYTDNVHFSVDFCLSKVISSSMYYSDTYYIQVFSGRWQTPRTNKLLGHHRFSA